MTVTTVLAVVPARDLAASRTWWTRLWGREPDQVPMPSDVEWHVPGGGGVQLVDDGERAGSGSVTLGVDDVDAEVAAIRERGIDAPQAETVPSGQFRVALLRDPDGNTVVLGQTLGA
ncbi:VOC family protein [Solicola sp. PLA-1-18]|uniref:VOC family protein n=1 Tax=Solicola sp. PLA-1-18 TaxID=3380532 RepID=UPI003B77CAC8